jgi:hypothetical protein
MVRSPPRSAGPCAGPGGARVCGCGDDRCVLIPIWCVATRKCMTNVPDAWWPKPQRVHRAGPQGARSRTHTRILAHAHDRKRRAEPDPEAGSLAETKLVVYAHDPLDSLLADVGPCAAATDAHYHQRQHLIYSALPCAQSATHGSALAAAPHAAAGIGLGGLLHLLRGSLLRLALRQQARLLLLGVHGRRRGRHAQRNIHVAVGGG